MPLRTVTCSASYRVYNVAVPNPVTKDLHLEHADYQLESLATMELGHLIANLEIPYNTVNSAGDYLPLSLA